MTATPSRPGSVGSHNVYPGQRRESDAGTFYSLHWDGWWNSEEGARACGVHLRTYRRWLSGRRPAPVYARRLVRVLGTGDLGEISPKWRDWRITRRGLLVSPYGLILEPGEIDATPYYRSLAEVLKAELAAVRAEVARHRKAAPCNPLPATAEDSGSAASAAPTPTGAAARRCFDHPDPSRGQSAREGEVSGPRGGSQARSLAQTPVPPMAFEAEDRLADTPAIASTRARGNR